MKILWALLIWASLVGALSAQDVFQSEDGSVNREAFYLVQKACWMGEPANCDYLSRKDINAGQMSLLVGEVIKDLFADCLFDYADACLEYGFASELAHFENADNSDAETQNSGLAAATVSYAKSCQLGNLVGCTMYAMSLEIGSGVAQDFDEALAIYERMCSDIGGFACDRYGLALHSAGLQDGEMHLGAMRQACDAGFATSCTTLGLWMQGEREGVNDYAAQFFTRACELGDRYGCEFLE